MGGAHLEGGPSYRQVFDEGEWYGLVAVRHRQEVGVRVPGFSAEVYAAPVVKAGQGLLQGGRARLCALVVAVGALGCCGVRYCVDGEASQRALYVGGG